MTVGQSAELIALLIVPILLRRILVKWVFVTGVISWVVPAGAFLVMTDGNLGLAVLIVALHGVCNDFFVITSGIFVSDVTRARTRAQTQSLYVIASFGIGNIIGSLIAGALFNHFVGTSTDFSAWNPTWYVTGVIAAITATLMIIYFRPRTTQATSEATRAIATLSEEAGDLRRSDTRRGDANVVSAALDDHDVSSADPR